MPQKNIKPVESKAPAAAPTNVFASRRGAAGKEPPPFKWKLVAESDGFNVVLLKTIEKKDAQNALENLTEQGYYDRLLIHPIEANIPQPKLKAIREIERKEEEKQARLAAKEAERKRKEKEREKKRKDAERKRLTLQKKRERARQKKLLEKKRREERKIKEMLRKKKAAARKKAAAKKKAAKKKKTARKTKTARKKRGGKKTARKKTAARQATKRKK